MRTPYCSFQEEVDTTELICAIFFLCVAASTIGMVVPRVLVHCSGLEPGDLAPSFHGQRNFEPRASLPPDSPLAISLPLAMLLLLRSLRTRVASFARPPRAPQRQERCQGCAIYARRTVST